MKTMVSAAVLFVMGYTYILSLAFKQQDVYEDLWTESMDIADKTLHVDFMQQMQKNSLQAERYVHFTLQDINYLVQVTDMLKTMSKKVNKPKDISDFLIARYKSYNSFLDTLLLQYFFKVTPFIKPTPAMVKYMASYRETMAKDPIYFVVGLLPCARLWKWLANNADIPKTNVYYTWKVDNMDGHPEKHYKALLNKYLTTPEQISNATALFRMQMQNEHDFFATS
ncbi:uncharacterized protein LOC113645516 [Tachysurus fulvidraco]|uniref:uncharacterized protein LOC113645516 n=1 Tax=Tachysurus fulvidraco TaxID=1234273 RepID=UPI000F4E7A63|nr:uncharacterized protein LOC113645516 [Tachysurus fulvidraco]